MNKAIFTGRTTNEVTYYPAKEDGTAIAYVAVALDHYKDKDTTFVNCVAFGKFADFIRDHLIKGKKYIFNTHIDSNKGEDGKQNGIKFIIDEIDFVEPKNSETSSES